MFIPFLPSLFSESKKEKKERKEKKKKRDSKDLEASSNDFTVENEEKDGSSSNSKSVFGMFRRSGRKDKRSSKHGSSDSLKRLSVDSTEFGDRRSSGVSIDESASAKVSTPSTEVVKETEKPQTQRDQPSEVEIVSAAHPVEKKYSERPDVPLAAEILKTVDTMMANNGEEEVQTKKDEEESVITPDNDKGSLKQEEQIAEKKPEPVVEMESQLQEANTKEHKQEESVNEQVLKPDNPDQEVLLKIENGPAVEKEEVHSLKKGQQKENQSQMQVEEFLKLNAKVGEVSTPKAKSEEQNEKEIGNGPAVEKEEVHSLEKGRQRENQIQLQVKEFLKLDAKVGEISTPKAENEEQEEKGERKSAEDSERRFNVIHKTPPFKGEGTFTTSTPKRESTKRAQVKKSGGPEIQVQSTNRAVKGDKQTSVVEFHFEAQIGNDIKDAKFSTEVLLAQLMEVNKKLRMLQEELLEFRKSNGKLA